MNRLLKLFGVCGCGLLLLGSEAAAEDWGSAFGQEGNRGARELNSRSSSYIAQPPVSMPSMEMNSFPVRLHFEFSDDETGTDKDNFPVSQESPGTATRAYAIDGCRFEVSTGQMAVDHWDLDPENELYIEAESLISGSTLHLPVEDYYFVGVSTELRAEALEGTEEACKRLLDGQPRFFGFASLTGTRLAVEGGGDRKRLKRAAKGDKAQVFLSWADDMGGLVLHDIGGMPVSLKSAVFTGHVERSGTWFLKAKPGFTIRRKKGGQ